MKYALLENVKQGEKLGRTIFTGDGRVLLEEGVVLTIGLISRLRQMGVGAIYLKDDRLKDVEVEEVVTETTRRETMEAFAESVQYIQVAKKDFDMKGISKTTEKIIEEILQNQNVLVTLADIRTSDNALFVHSTNVCIISVLVGIKLGLTRTELKDLAVGALFHDIGKIIDPSKLDSKSRQEAGSNDHTWLGFNFLRKKHEISTVAAHVAFGHHENVDGSGYPRKISGENIPLFAKIVAVANHYDNLITPLDGGIGLNPHEACEQILGLTNINFDHQVVWEFLRSIAFYPTGRQVKLSTGETGVIVGQNSGLPQRPIVRVIDVFNRSKFDDFEVKEIDLGKETTIFITRVL
ncbi:HD-GYP domain-containing protein [Calidifontibacillus oryziterrae]|uniref:HD-GYP domain-containing protein n=1 Tax=Calidifontibacillus oryziterrae TaxID=1191699 RepID=UPI0002DB342B|nr:HD domain-containing phosphohydrolase [Calidifontibacillus oryziterrae]